MTPRLWGRALLWEPLYSVTGKFTRSYPDKTSDNDIGMAWEWQYVVEYLIETHAVKNEISIYAQFSVSKIYIYFIQQIGIYSKKL